jgi:hypothetical protein
MGLVLLSGFLLGFAACASDRQSTTPAGGPEIVELRGNEAELYPGREDGAIVSLERLPTGIGVMLKLRSDDERFSHFLVSENDGPPRKFEDGEIPIVYDDNHKPEAQRKIFSIQAVAASGTGSRPFELIIGYFPKELYEKSGQTAPGYVILQKSDIPFSSSRVEDWIVERPGEADVKFAEETWGAIVKDSATPTGKAMALARALIDALNPHRGIPSDLMKTNPFEQYLRATSGRDRVWCGNLAEIFVHAANALGLPARSIDMSRVLSQGPGFELRTAEGHATTEIFDALANKWIWIDLTFSLLGMELQGYGLIHMAELHRSLNDPEKIKLLTGIEYDPATKTDRKIALTESDKRNSLLNFFKKDQTFRYRKRDPGRGSRLKPALEPDPK